MSKSPVRHTKKEQILKSNQLINYPCSSSGEMRTASVDILRRLENNYQSQILDSFRFVMISFGSNLTDLKKEERYLLKCLKFEFHSPLFITFEIYFFLSVKLNHRLIYDEKKVIQNLQCYLFYSIYIFHL